MMGFRLGDPPARLPSVAAACAAVVAAALLPQSPARRCCASTRCGRRTRRRLEQRLLRGRLQSPSRQLVQHAGVHTDAGPLLRRQPAPAVQQTENCL